MQGPIQNRYDRIAILLHWIVGAAVLAQLSFGWMLGELKRGTPARALATNLHKSSGLLLALLILARLLWRLRHRPPAYPEGFDAWQMRAARLVLAHCSVTRGTCDHDGRRK